MEDLDDPDEPVLEGSDHDLYDIIEVLAGSKNGYFSTKLQVCTGKADSREKALGAKDVKELTAHLHWKKRHVFYFTNKQLLVDHENDLCMRDRQHGRTGEVSLIC